MKLRKHLVLPFFVSLGLSLSLSSCIKGIEDTFAIQLKKDIEEIDTYLNAHSIDAIEDISGLRYTVDVLGKGYPPRISDNVKFEYVGKLLDGTVFESKTYSTFTPITGFISGFQIGLPQIPTGSTVTLYIPSGYGYGNRSSNTIPANSILVFTIKMKDIQAVTSEQNQLGTDTIALDAFFTSNPEIENVLKDTTGLRYTIDQAGIGDSPNWYNRVSISYSGYLITNNQRGAKFSQGTSEPTEATDSRVVTFIRGFQHGLRKMKKGCKATLYIPSVLAYGTSNFNSGSVNVPANSNVIYEVELIDILEP